MRLPTRSPGANRGLSPPGAPYATSGIRQAGLFDAFDLCKWFELPWCDEPKERCVYDRTDTSCWGVVLMCKDRGRTATGELCSGGWYVCGACLGLPW